MSHLSSRLSLSLLVGVLAIVAVMGAKPTLSEAALETASCQKILLPGYFYPGLLWQKAALAKGTWMIINPDSGSGASISEDYVKNVPTIQAAGLKAIGYVSTRYANRPIDEVRADIERYYAWYHVDGIFLDEVPTDPAHLAYYQDLAATIRLHAGSLVVLNPGTVPNEQYVAIGDTNVVFEGTYASYKRASFPVWMSTYPSAKFSHLVYQTPSKYLGAVMRRSRALNAGFVYITNDAFPNPWDTLPSYWKTEKDQTAASCR